jgi:hypothetical protein
MNGLLWHNFHSAFHKNGSVGYKETNTDTNFYHRLSHFPWWIRKKGKILTLLGIRLSSFLPQPNRTNSMNVFAASVANKKAKAHQGLQCWLWRFWFKRYGLRTDKTWFSFTFLFLIFKCSFFSCLITYSYQLVRSFVDSWTTWRCLKILIAKKYSTVYQWILLIAENHENPFRTANHKQSVAADFPIPLQSLLSFNDVPKGAF